jgi:hypothetical protein
MKDTIITYNSKEYLLNLNLNLNVCGGYLCLIKNETKESLGELMNMEWKQEYLELKISNYDSSVNVTIIRLWCYSESNRAFSPKKDVVFIQENLLDIYSHHGCYLCQKQLDFKETIGQCVNGKRIHFLTKLHPCWLEKEYDPITSSCSATITFPYWTLISIPIVVLFILSLFVVVVLLLGWRLKKLQHNYEELKDKHKAQDINEEFN